MSGCFPTYKCLCSCHSGGPKYMRTSNPPQPCCDCDNFVYDSHPLERLEERIKKLEEQIKSSTEMYKHLSISIAGYQDLKVLVHDFIKSANGRIEKSVDVHVIYTMRQTIETWQKGCEVLINNLQSRNSDIEKRLDEMGKVWREDIEKYERFEKFQDEKIKEIEHWKEGIMGNMRFHEDKPYKCPVCNGSGRYYLLGIQEKVFHNSETVHCASCEGKGIVWG